MQVIFKHKLTLLSLLTILVISFSTRVFFLDRVTPGILQDELKHIMTEKSLFLTGKSVYQDWNPFSFTSEPHDVKDSELLSVVMSPFVGVLPYSMYFVRLPFAMLGVLDVFLIIAIGYYLFGLRPALFAGFLAAINPYLIFFSRLAFDTQVSMFFMLLGMVLLFFLKKWWKVVAFLSFAIAFYCYTGMKLIFFPFIAFFAWWFAFVYQKKEKLPYVVVGILSFLLVVSFVVMLKSNPTAGRAAEILTPFSASIAKEVATERNHALLSPLTSLAENKFTIWFTHAIGAYLDAFSLRSLFVTGENSTHLALWYVGYFYLIDIVFILLGVVSLFKHNKKALWFLTGIILLSPITGAVRVDALGSHVMHAVMMFPALVLVGGYGLFYTFEKLRSRSKLLVFAIAGIYAIFFGYFLYTYFLRLPVYNSEGFEFSKRVVSKYLSEEQKNNKQIVVVTKDPKEMFQDYVLYGQLYTTKQQAQKVNAILKNGEEQGIYRYGSLTFTNKPREISHPESQTIIFESILPVNVKGAFMLVPALTDGGEVFRIYNGKTCSNYQLHTYPYGIRFSDLAVENLSEERFCTTFITALMP